MIQSVPETATPEVRNRGTVGCGTAGQGGVEIRLARPEDNEGLLALTRATPMAGTIALRIDRDPDFFALLRARGEAVVLVAERDGQIIGCFSAAIHWAYIDGKLERVCHAGDLKGHPKFTGSRVSLRLIPAMETYLREAGIDLCFSLVAKGNDRVTPALDGRHGTPREEHLGEFLVDQLLPWPFAGSRRGLSVEAATRRDLPQVVELIDGVCCARQFAPGVTVEELELLIHRKPAEGFAKVLVARDEGRIVATLTLEDTSRLRQNVLMGLPAGLRVALGLLRVLTLPMRRFRVPRIGQPLTMLYVRHAACVDGHRAALRVLIAEARVEAFRLSYTFLSVGLHERDPLREAVKGFPGFTFHSQAMATSLITPNRVKQLGGLVPYEDFSLV